MGDALTVLLAVLCAAVWVYLIGFRGQFWQGPVRDLGAPPAPPRWPAVTAVIPARNEAGVIAASVGSLLRQDYPGQFSIVVVDDDSDDGTAAEARAASAAHPGRALAVVTGHGPPAGWTGKLWALKQGVDAAKSPPPDYWLFTDADIVHAPDTLAWLAAKACDGDRVLTSLMARLRCESLAERSHVPAFIYFFHKLFPVAWVGRRDSAGAAAAGGCMLVRADALERAGGVAAIRNALIDDCALAAKLKAQGPIWLGLTDRVRSIRPYDTLAEVRQMVSRSAYAQLRYSPLLLAGTALAMAMVFLAPPLLAIFASGLPRYLGLAAWLVMAVSFVPMLRFYRLSPLWAVALPAIALLYLIYTFDSAWRHCRRRGGQWKGRVHADAPSLQ
jgi:hopene-associated glycosyltransferase HpnB